MAHSLEVRAPFLDYSSSNGACACRRRSSCAGRRANTCSSGAGAACCRAEILYRRKQGFATSLARQFRARRGPAARAAARRADAGQRPLRRARDRAADRRARERPLRPQPARSGCCWCSRASSLVRMAAIRTRGPSFTAAEMAGRMSGPEAASLLAKTARGAGLGHLLAHGDPRPGADQHADPGQAAAAGRFRAGRARHHLRAGDRRAVHARRAGRDHPREVARPRDVRHRIHAERTARRLSQRCCSRALPCPSQASSTSRASRPSCMRWRAACC